MKPESLTSLSHAHTHTNLYSLALCYFYRGHIFGNQSLGTFLAYFPYFAKIKEGLWNHLAVSVSLYILLFLSTCVYLPLNF
jgi:hypothetical protein